MEKTEVEVLERLDSDAAHVVDKNDRKWLWVSDEGPVDSRLMESLEQKGLVRVFGSGEWLLAQITWNGRNYIKAKMQQK